MGDDYLSRVREGRDPNSPDYQNLQLRLTISQDKGQILREVTAQDLQSIPLHSDLSGVLLESKYAVISDEGIRIELGNLEARSLSSKIWLDGRGVDVLIKGTDPTIVDGTLNLLLKELRRHRPSYWPLVHFLAASVASFSLLTILMLGILALYGSADNDAASRDLTVQSVNAMFVSLVAGVIVYLFTLVVLRLVQVKLLPPFELVPNGDKHVTAKALAAVLAILTVVSFGLAIFATLG